MSLFIETGTFVSNNQKNMTCAFQPAMVGTATTAATTTTMANLRFCAYEVISLYISMFSACQWPSPSVTADTTAAATTATTGFRRVGGQTDEFARREGERGRQERKLRRTG